MSTAGEYAQAGSTVETVLLTKFQRVMLRTIIIVQMAHTSMLLIVDIIELLGLVNSPGSTQSELMLRLSWLFTLFIVLFVEIALLRFLSKLKSWVWTWTLILLIDASLYLVFTQQFDHPVMRGIEKALLIAALFGFAALWTSRRAFSICAMNLWLVPVTLILSTSIVFINGLYFPRGTGWEKPLPPMWYRIILDSRFSFPQECSLVLCWGCYALVSALVWAFGKLSSNPSR